ncbi:50S ribosomal protein L21 [Candidatus Saccharibacteria bacterium RIFCSPHIGHO2_12_FULL_41_12]|nr:MAG: 50S ribosomal protein L21 [Candidatus Saccharibacteria bacterium RIFCSPHIGHO2_12_FULL_41_12]
MSKAVIATGGKQYLVSTGDSLEIELVESKDKNITFEPLLVFDDKDVKIGTPTVKDAKVTAEITEQDKQTDKVTSIRYKAKKRVHKVRGHRQRKTIIKITKIS